VDEKVKNCGGEKEGEVGIKAKREGEGAGKGPRERPCVVGYLSFFGKVSNKTQGEDISVQK